MFRTVDEISTCFTSRLKNKARVPFCLCSTDWSPTTLSRIFFFAWSSETVASWNFIFSTKVFFFLVKDRGCSLLSDLAFWSRPERLLARLWGKLRLQNAFAGYCQKQLLHYLNLTGCPAETGLATWFHRKAKRDCCFEISLGYFRHLVKTVVFDTVTGGDNFRPRWSGEGDPAAASPSLALACESILTFILQLLDQRTYGVCNDYCNSLLQHLVKSCS